MSDETEIEKTLTRLLIGFSQHDADAFAAVYTADADWTNAFGRTLHGRDAIVEYLRELFADSRFTAGTPTGAPEITAREVSSDVVVVTTYMEVAGQQTVDGDVLPTRRNHSLKVLVRTDDGRWLVCSDIYMDARDEITHASAS